MRIALILTTINVPRVLELYRAYGPDVRVFVAADRKTDPAAQNFCVDLGGCTYLSPEMQTSFNYACSELLGWNCIQRRNIALLEAVRWGAELIASIDDDNIPMSETYFDDFEELFFISQEQGERVKLLGMIGAPVTHSGLLASSPSGWFDVGQLLTPVASHRGIPHDCIEPPSFTHVTGARVGVAAGICLGDPDISAVTRIAQAPTVHGVSEVLRAGVLVDPRQTKTVFNSQNTAFIRELAPAFFMLPGLGRFDDIFASLIMQRVMRERQLHVHFGKPFVIQQRNPHDLLRDLKAEAFGMEHVEAFADWLDKFNLPGQSVLDDTQRIFARMAYLDWMPSRTADAALAFCADIEKVL